MAQSEIFDNIVARQPLLMKCACHWQRSRIPCHRWL